LTGWLLRDDGNEWEFPATNITAGQFMIVFASGKNRRVPGLPLHTSFQLSSGGEYLALVKPDGVTIVSEFTDPPSQFPNISFGLSQAIRAVKVISNTSPATVFVPTNGVLGTTWTTNDFNDSSWRSGTNGVGFDTGAAQPGE